MVKGKGELIAASGMAKIMLGVMTSLLIAAIIGGFRATHELTRIAERIQGLENIMLEKIIAQEKRHDQHVNSSDEDIKELRSRLLYLERRFETYVQNN